MSVADGLNLFAYVRNDAINFDDPGGTIKNRKCNRSLSESSSHEQAAGSSGTFSSLRDIPAAVARRLGSKTPIIFDSTSTVFELGSGLEMQCFQERCLCEVDWV